MIISRKCKDTKAMEQKKHKSRLKMPLINNAPFKLKEAYKTTRTNIMFSVEAQRCKQIVVTSASKGEGKTMTCVNLAISFAQTGKKVLVIDGDLRKPHIHEVLDISNERGLSDILAGFCKREEVIKRVEEQGIDAIPTGQIPPNPAELLSRDQMKNLLYELSKVYDYIFIDTPPVNLVSDAIILSSMVSGMILVAKQGKSDYRDIDEAIKKLAFVNAKVLGVILTGTK